MILERFAYTPMGTFGKLKHKGKEWFTIERPWINNQRNISCIPENTYTANRYLSPTFGRGEVWQLNDVPDRTFVQIHRGNTQHDVVGCIAIGKELGAINGEWAVVNSRKAFSEFMEATKDLDEIEIQITHYEQKYTGMAEDYL